ncbi:hypothetical protein CGRA01v4_11783 [Colletotrichum graminicola]|nr:hypothetical protein CGRA01v4_11783 [Colletotrichum graminicola]
MAPRGDLIRFWLPSPSLSRLTTRLPRDVPEDCIGSGRSWNAHWKNKERVKPDRQPCFLVASPRRVATTPSTR